MAAAQALDPLMLDPDCKTPHQLLLVRYDRSKAARDFIHSPEAGAQWTTVITDIQSEAADAAGFCSVLWQSIFVIRLQADPARLIPNTQSLIRSTEDEVQFGYTRKGCEFWLKFKIPARQIGVVPITQDETRLILCS